jgi:hypothetical protein
MLRGFNAENGDHAYVTRLFLSEGPAPDHVEIHHATSSRRVGLPKQRST